MKLLAFAGLFIAVSTALAVAIGHAINTPDDDEYETEYQIIIHADRGRVPMTCTGCGDWFYADELNGGICHECACRGAYRRLDTLMNNDQDDPT